jgi:hypothetical protein
MIVSETSFIGKRSEGLSIFKNKNAADAGRFRIRERFSVAPLVCGLANALSEDRNRDEFFLDRLDVLETSGRHPKR